jgi:hypothetical protein
VDAPESEDLVVRQYRYLLRTAPADAMEAAHREALADLSAAARSAVLRAVQTGLVAGLRLSAGHVRQLAHLITLGERRVPGAFLAALDARTQRELADRVVLAEATFGLFGGYARWDGAEPDPPAEPWSQDGFGEHWREALTMHVTYRNFVGGPSSPDTAFGGRG